MKSLYYIILAKTELSEVVEDYIGLLLYFKFQVSQNKQ